MAKYDDINSGSLGSFSDILAGMAINTAMTMARGLVMELSSSNIGNFNKMNHDFMRIHMMRNAYERIITLNTVGENAYRNGDGDATATPALYPSYTRGNNYMEFVVDAHDGSRVGQMTTRIQTAGEENANLYFDAKGEITNLQPNFTGKYTDKNSILYKTRKLLDNNKIKTIISQFHTTGVSYNGQIGSKQYGESHGRNLLTKKAENGGGVYDAHGYDNPYCRVWTHHYKYDTLARTIRGGHSDPDVKVEGNMNIWDNFEWGVDIDGKQDTHEKDDSKYLGSKGENYYYAWRGEHNQTRRKENTVLDPKDTGTNLVNITPKYLGGESKNIHTKSCMFSIENLAWKDYDPYSFEEALSWEQRGPFGGRIMWFPPYGIEINETASAKWNTNEFIGRGEPVYTYVNSERTGNLSFIMLTDHPSSVDYATWWDNKRNNENDYLRYFAGCFDNDKDNSKGHTGGLEIRPPDMDDEYFNINPPLVQAEKTTKKVPKQVPATENIEVKFNVFFPNNYSGLDDRYTKPDSDVDAIMYLLFGHYTQKTIKNQKLADIPLNESTDINDSNIDNFPGYEMRNFRQNGLTNHKQSGDAKIRNYAYRCDSDRESEKLKTANYNDTTCYGLNLSINSQKVTVGNTDYDLAKGDKYYSLAEVAAALYKVKGGDSNKLSDILLSNKFGLTRDRVDGLVKIFNDYNLVSIECKGCASNAGSKNETLFTQRANTIGNWIRSVDKWKNVSDPSTNTDGTRIDEALSSANSAKDVKMNRRAECTLKFGKEVNNTVDEDVEIQDNENGDYYPHYKGFKYFDSTIVEGELWHFYTKESSTYFYEQKASTSNNYDDSGATEATVTEQQLYDIFNNELFKPKMESDGNDANGYCFGWELTAIGKKVAALLCTSFESVVKKITGSDELSYIERPEFDTLWKYGKANNLAGNVNEDSSLANAAISLQETSHPEGGVSPADRQIKFTNEEENYIRHVFFNENDKQTSLKNINELESYIILYRLLDCVSKVKHEDNTEREVCNEGIDDEMLQKRVNNVTECTDNLWVDRGDGMLIQGCYIEKYGKDLVKSRKDEFNKLRYDQEYRFYKNYERDHPLMFERLQEKLKYFNPAFHSMSPEGFNMRCNFLQQCTRQGNTKTMSDKYGRTANNLAFGRPPYCVLRLGDFYYQMIVIDSVSFDFNVSDGLQWDLNPEGNGVQPMLCKVNISFKFIGGGDITGPVQRLQNAMSFNYYANTSFYDNRADRVEYQPTNWQTMGGAGNNEVDTEKSYAYLAKNYDNTPLINKSVIDNGNNE